MALARTAGLLAGDARLVEPMRYAVAGGGKRLRPVLCIAAYRAAGGDAAGRDELHDAAAAIELVHTYSLVHDDLPCMDDDDLRRGRPTLHRAHGVGPAMLAGFALIPFACSVLHRAARHLGVPAHTAAAAVAELCRGAGAGGMVGGQQLDLEAEGRHLDEAALRTVHGMKTGALFAAACRIGALLAGATPGTVTAFGDFGQRLGLAFQIADDVLDVTEDATALGKTPGKDAEAAKSTFVTLLGVEGARTAAAAEAAAAVRQLHGAGIHSAILDDLARFAADRDR